MEKPLSILVIAILALSPFLLLSSVALTEPTAEPAVSIINPGPGQYAGKWNASTTVRDLGTPNFIFYSNETSVDSTFYINVTVRNAERMKGWGVGIVFDNTTLRYVSAWRPPDHVFAPVEEMGWTIIAPGVTFEAVNATHTLLKWGCAYLMPDGETWTFNGTGRLCQIQFKIIKAVNETYRKDALPIVFNSTWTSLYLHPTEEIKPTMEEAYFEYSWPFYVLTITTSVGGTTNPVPGFYWIAWGNYAFVTATPETGYLFWHWERNGTDFSFTNPVAIIMNADYTLNAVFASLTAPSIDTPTQDPLADNVQPNQQVTVLVDVTDLDPGVKNVTLMFKNDTATWYNLTMTFDANAQLYVATIPGHAGGIQVRYMIEAYDYAGNHAVNSNGTSYFVYTVIPEFPRYSMLAIFMLVATIIILTTKLKPAKTKKRDRVYRFG